MEIEEVCRRFSPNGEILVRKASLAPAGWAAVQT
jgi:hypothetical protein